VTHRLFVALPLPGEAREALQACQYELREYLPAGLVRWTKPDGMHVTLSFLGDVDGKAVPELEEALEKACEPHRAFSLGLDGLGAFPQAGPPKVIWAGTRGDLRALHELQHDTERTAAPYAANQDRKPFTGHVTLGRVRAQPDRVGRALRAVEPEWPGTWPVVEARLMESELTPQGSVYHVRAAFRLGGA
jgi:2'-5' RNA ligase